MHLGRNRRWVPLTCSYKWYSCVLFKTRLIFPRINGPIVSNGCNAVPTLQRCVELKIVVAIHPVQRHLKTESRCCKLISTRKQYTIPINIFDCDYTYNIILTLIIITWNNQAFFRSKNAEDLFQLKILCCHFSVIFVQVLVLWSLSYYRGE